MKKLTLLQKFSVSSFISLLLLAFILANVISSTMSNNMLDRAKEITAAFVTHEVVSEFKAAELMDPKIDQEYHDFSQKIEHLSTGPYVEGIKIWNNKHMVVWSDKQELVGQSFPDNDSLNKALAGETNANFITREALATKYSNEVSLHKIMELYIPIRYQPGNEIDVVFEIYKNLEPLYQNISKYTRMIWAATAAGMAALFLLFFIIVRNASRELVNQTAAIIEADKVLQEQLIKSKEEWEEAFDIINDAITIHDKDFNIIQANKAAEEMLGVSRYQLQKQKCFTSYHGTNCAPTDCPSCQTLQSGIPSITEIFEPHIDKHLEIKALPRFDKNNELIGLVHVVRDIDARVRAEEEQQKLATQLIQSQKMESIGRLAGGVAHDFNNLLSAIIGYSELALQELPADHPIAEDLQIIKDSGDKASALTRQLLAFSRKQVLEVKPINLSSVVNNMLKMLKRLIGEDLELSVSTSATRAIEADPGQIEQVVLNLAINARDAMPDGGHLMIEVSELEIDDPVVLRHEEMKPGAYAMLAISDTGTGMPAEVQEHIFEPFYTTKGKDKGTGLGLATVYGIIKQHNGYIYVYSEPDQGTSFKIYLPISTAEMKTIKDQGPPVELPKGTETILVVEDEPSIRRLVADILQPLGYNLLGAANADEALKISNAHQDNIDLLLTDVIMPGMSGKELADILQEKKPEMKVIFMSGYTDDAISRLGVLEPGINFIQKPLTSKKLTEKIRATLNNS